MTPPPGFRARAALAAEPQGAPSDEEWDALVERLWDQYETAGYQGERFMYCGDFGTACDLLRKELTRYGAQAVPVAVDSPFFDMSGLRQEIEQLLNHARCLESRTVGNAELTDRILDAIFRWALPLPEAQP